jgi:DNA polymerase-3 subunit gamma/tau
MSYLVLARKYRPRGFPEMVGQDHVVQALVNALTTQRLHHAYLFTGTRGVGKTTVSRILAKSLNCQGADGTGGITASPCGVCQACTDIDAGRFVDYTELDAASNRGVDEVQALLEQAVYKPVQGRFKVFMIDEVHMLTNTAFNAMLKTLEEPPEYLKFVLATTDPQKVPVTVLSRCLQFNLRPMAPETIREHLQRVLDIEKVGCESTALRLLARAARGSMRDALSLTDQAIAFGSGRIDEPTVRRMLGSVDSTYVFQLIGALADGDGKSVVEVCESVRLHGLSAASTLEEMCTVLQRMAVLQALGHPASQDATDPEFPEIADLATRLPVDETQLLYSICLQGRGDLGLAPDEYAALTMVLLRLLAFKLPSAQKKTPARAESAPALTPPPVGQRLPVRRSGTDAATGAATSAAPSAGPAFVSDALATVPPDVVDTPSDVVAVPVRVQTEGRADVLQPNQQPAFSPTEEGDFWHASVQQLVAQGVVSAMARELALQSQLVGRDTDQWVLRVERESLNQPVARERLAAALRSIGFDVVLCVEIGRVTDCPARRISDASAERQLAAEKIIIEDPFVQGMMREFGAKIVPGSIKPL